jgi:hypothetical protein
MAQTAPPSKAAKNFVIPKFSSEIDPKINYGNLMELLGGSDVVSVRVEHPD